MRIVHIVCSYPPYYGGMGNTVLETVSELHKRGHDVRVLTPLYEQFRDEPEYLDEIQDRTRFAKRLTPSIAYGNAARLSGIRKELDGADVVHFHYPFFGTANLVRRWKRDHPTVPLVLTYHMDTRGPGWKGLIFKAYAAFFLSRMLNAADLLIGSSLDYIAASDAGDHFLAYKEKWMELPFGVNTDRFSPGEKSEALMVECGLDPSVPIILFVGGMDAAHYFKGVPVLLEALLLLKKQGMPVQAVFVGDGGLREGFELKARGFGLGDTVRFVGKVSDDALPEYYRLADLLVLPSTTRGEAFGMVLLEAMASGVPVVASDLPGVRTLAVHSGGVVPPGDGRALAAAIAALYADPARLSDMRTRVRRVVESEYSWPSVVGRLDTAYTSLVSRLSV